MTRRFLLAASAWLRPYLHRQVSCSSTLLGLLGAAIGAGWLGALLVWAALTSGFIIVMSPLDLSSITPEAGRAFAAPAKIPASPYLFSPSRQQLHGGVILVERAPDGTRQLGPPYTPIAEISARGAGRYTITDRRLIFSTLDATDPRHNGRGYVLTGSVEPEFWLLILGIGGLVVGGLVAGLGAGPGLAAGALASLAQRRRQAAALMATSLACGAMLALWPVATRIGFDNALLGSLAQIALLGGCAVIVCEMLRPAGRVRHAFAHNLVHVAGVAAVLFLAVVTSGLLHGQHRAVMSDVVQASEKVYQYRIVAMPLGLSFAGDEARILNRRTSVADAQGVLPKGSLDEKGLTPPEGRASFWANRASFSFRSPGGPHEAGNAIQISGSLRVSFGLALLLVLLSVASAAIVSCSWMAACPPRPDQSASTTATPDLARPDLARPDLARLSVGIALAGAGFVILWGQAGSSAGSSAGARTTLWLDHQIGWSQLLSICAALLMLGLLPWHQGMRAWPKLSRRTVGVSLLLAAACVPFLGVLGTWSSVGDPNAVALTSMHLLGQVQASDSFGYLHGAVDLLTAGWLNDWNSRRPLTSALTALRVMAAGPQMTGVIVLGALFIGIFLMLATREVLRLAGGVAAVAFLVMCGSFVSEWTPTTMSEGTGFAFGLLALAALLAAWRTDSIVLFFLGIIALSTAVMARSGPQFVVPFMVFAGALIQWKKGSRRSLAWLAAGLLAAMLGVMHAHYLVKTLHGSAGMIQSNFSYTLYGLAVGGKGWMQIFADHPELFAAGAAGPAEPKIYQYAIAEITRAPGTIIVALAQEILRTPGFFSRYFDPVLLNVWLMTGVATSLLALRSRIGIMCAAAILGIVVSSPLLITDGARRVFAAVVPMLALLGALGADAIVKLSLSAWRGERLWAAIGALRQPAWSVAPVPSHRLAHEPALWAGLAAAVLVLVTPLAISPKQRQLVGRLPELAACASGEHQLVIGRRAFLDLFRIHPDREPPPVRLPDIRRADLLQAARMFDNPFHDALETLALPTTLRLAVRMIVPTDLSIVFPVLIAMPAQMGLDGPGDLVAICARKAGVADSNRIGNLEVYEARTATPIILQGRP